MNLIAEFIRGNGRTEPDGPKDDGPVAESPAEAGPAAVCEASAVRVSWCIRYTVRQTSFRDEV